MATAKAAAPRISVTWSERRASRLASPRARGRDPTGTPHRCSNPSPTELAPVSAWLWWLSPSCQPAPMAAAPRISVTWSVLVGIVLATRTRVRGRDPNSLPCSSSSLCWHYLCYARTLARRSCPRRLTGTRHSCDSCVENCAPDCWRSKHERMVTNRRSMAGSELEADHARDDQGEAA